MTRKIFLTLMITFTILNVGYFELAIRRTNNISDQYLDELIKNSWLVGCVMPTQDYDYCREVGSMVEWGRLIPDLKRVSKETGK